MGGSPALDVSQAARIAQRVPERNINHCYYPYPNVEPAERWYEYWVSMDERVFEFPLLKDGKECGYVLVSGTRRLPPILEIQVGGTSLRSALERCLEVVIRKYDIREVARRWMYYGPLDLVVEIESNKGSFTYIRIPNLFIREYPRRLDYVFNVRADRGWLKSQWVFYESEIFSEWRWPCYILPGVRPVKYNQTCSSSLAQERETASNQSPNYCSPACIAGCAPTGWTVLASAWKSTGSSMLANIFSDARDWNLDWPSAYANSPPQPVSENVNRRMWAVHDYMATQCDGATDDEHLQSGARIFADYGVHWSWDVKKNIDYKSASSIIYNQPLLLCAQSVWVDQEPPDGHCVVAHGYNDLDRSLFVCLGWGSSFPDKWIALSTVWETSAFFVRPLPIATKRVRRR